MNYYNKEDGKYIVFLTLKSEDEKQAEEIMIKILAVLHHHKAPTIEEVTEEVIEEIQDIINDGNVACVSYGISPLD